MVQTEEELVPKQKVLILENKFFKCLNNISDGIRQYIDESKKRNAEKIESALLHYHQQVSSKLLKGLSKDIHSYTPTFILPHTSARHETISKETFESSNIPQSLTNANLKTSTPNLNGKLSEQIHKTSAQNSNKDFTNMQNSNPQTSVKSIHKMTAQENVKSRSSTQTSITSTFKTPKLDAFSSGDSLFTEKIFFNREGSNNSYANINKKDFEAIDRFEDISYDFLSLNLPSGRFDPSKMPEHKLHGDDHNKHSDQQIDSFPVKLFPS
ncbi:uncharacterized protein CDAR_460691 [Caerostris darwini]|uniref:Uncharacterized protein n=1 Tax=Caerostris darwini TaxID=1538125 RepID=A0AAV4PSB5_9ARAC|nr:uncharacterized protein CDAR_460691 [Caerostris darwini]